MSDQKPKKKIALLIILCVSLSVLNCKNDKKETVVKTETEAVEKAPFFKLSLAQWSLHKAIREEGMSPIDFAQKANELGFEGIEYVSQLYRDEINEMGMDSLLEKLKDKSEQYKVKNVLIMIDGEGAMASTNDEEREKAIENHYRWVDAAKYLGCHSIRVNAHGEGTSEEVAKAAVDGLSKLADYASKQGINILVENHGGYTSNGKWLADVIRKVDRQNCGTLPDFGNFCLTTGYGSIKDPNCTEAYDIYTGVKELLPFAKAVSAKSYDFDANGNEQHIDYFKMLQIVKDAGYTGFIGVEYEGDNLGEIAGIQATRDLMLNAAKKLN